MHKKSEEKKQIEIETAVKCKYNRARKRIKMHSKIVVIVFAGFRRNISPVFAVFPKRPKYKQV